MKPLYPHGIRNARKLKTEDLRAIAHFNRIIKNFKNIFDFKYEDFELIGYDPWPAIKAPVAV